MKKLVSILALMAIVLTVSSGTDDARRYLAVGDQVPALAVSSQSGIIKMEHPGTYVLLTFWKSADAQSRIDCNRYSTWFATHSNDALRHVAVNFDSRKEIFEEIVKLDNLERTAQYNVKGDEAARIIRDYDLQLGLGSMLVSPDGEIIAFNPSLKTLESL